MSGLFGSIVSGLGGGSSGSGVLPDEDELVKMVSNLVLPAECNVANSTVTEQALQQTPSYKQPKYEPNPHLLWADSLPAFPGNAAILGLEDQPDEVWAALVAAVGCLLLLVVFWTVVGCVVRVLVRRNKTVAVDGNPTGNFLSSTRSIVIIALFFTVMVSSAVMVVVGATQVQSHFLSGVKEFSSILNLVNSSSTALSSALDTAERTLLGLARVAVDGSVGCIPGTDSFVNSIVGNVNESVTPYFEDWSRLPTEVMNPLHSEMSDVVEGVHNTGLLFTHALVASSLVGLVAAAIVAAQVFVAFPLRCCTANVCLIQMSNRMATAMTVIVLLLTSLTFGLGVGGLLYARHYCIDPDTQLVNAIKSSPSIERDVLRYYSTCEVPADAVDADILPPSVLYQAKCYSDHIRALDADEFSTFCQSDAEAMLAQEKESLTSIVDDAVESMNCASVNPLYEGIVHSGCVGGIEWAAVIMWSALVLALSSVVVVSMARGVSLGVLRESSAARSYFRDEEYGR